MHSGPEFGNLALDHIIVSPEAPNFGPPEWPPSGNFPVVVDASGHVISRFEDSIWNVTIWIGYVSKLNFGDARRRKDDFGNTPENSFTLKLIVIWWLYRRGKTRNPRRLVSIFASIRPAFVFCSKQNINATDLSRYPLVVEKLAKHISSQAAKDFILLCHQIWESREDLGFHLLSPADLQQFAKKIDNAPHGQTAYIPPRIWNYQVSRLKACLDDFNQHSDQIIKCYEFCIEAYVHNAGSLAKACSQNFPALLRPFSKNNLRHKDKYPHAIYHGPFIETAKKFGIYSLLDRWIPNLEKGGAASFSSYFNLISLVGNAYIINFSLMRFEEVFSLKASSLTIERDEDIGEDIYMLCGVTTKTVKDDDARWITAPSVKTAIGALSTIANLRIKSLIDNPKTPSNKNDAKDPYLFQRPSEPWRRKSEGLEYTQNIRPKITSYNATLQAHAKLFDPEEMKVTARDLQIAILVTPTLDPKEFAIGKVWPLAWHQLRRTGAVNMTGSGLVSDGSLQYQLKHATRAMSRYYGSGYYHLKFGLNSLSTNEYIKTVYEMMAKELLLVTSPRFISPHGVKRKEQLTSFISEKDHIALARDAKKGLINYRPMFLGACMNDGPCEYGGFEHVARCGGGGGPACESALYDKQMLPRIIALKTHIDARLASADPGTPLDTSLKQQKRAVENAINVITIS
ncbi:hypothetical protein HX870_17415 [Pseudomonas gingeri]|uniref:hypothetical protein n=1 Tax=Pseudomonas gingeri TaxID=117681 RepID=UPI0015A11521|nr:hypothetical protein [Pseudomonas gingeri]NWD69382.1 hypothetical protein [Pseudomonas gingeri]